MMNKFETLAEVWKEPRKVSMPDPNAIIRQATREKNKLANMIVAQAALLVLALLSLGFVISQVQFHYASSTIGISLMILCIVGYTFLRSRQAYFLLKTDISISPKILLVRFTRFHQQQKWIDSTGVTIYTYLLNIAFAFYFYEMIIVAPLTQVWKISLVSIYIGWMLFSGIYFGRKTRKKEENKTMAVIHKLQQLNKMLDSV